MNVGAPERRAPRREPDSETCMISGCGQPAVRSLALAEARRAFSSLPESGRRAPLCRAHYKEWKKATRESRQLDRLGR
jgi:hypothetical protein